MAYSFGHRRRHFLRQDILSGVVLVSKLGVFKNIENGKLEDTFKEISG